MRVQKSILFEYFLQYVEIMIHDTIRVTLKFIQEL